MTISAGVLAASGTNTTSSNTLAITTTQTVPNGQRVFLAVVCGNNIDAVSASGGGVSWALVGTQNANNKAGGLSVFMSGSGGVASGSTITVTLAASNAHRQYIAQSFVLDSQMYVDTITQQSGGSTSGGLASSAPFAISRFNTVTEALGISFLFNDNPANTITASPAADGSATTTDASVGSLTCTWHITESGEQPAVTYSWPTAARYGGMLLSVSEAPLAGADTDTSHVLWGIGANFTENSFPDPYTGLEADTAGVWGPATVSDPQVAPVLSLGAGGSLTPNTTYYIGYSWSNGAGSKVTTYETLLSPVSAITTTNTQLTIDITVPSAPVGGDPVDHLPIYASTSSFATGHGSLQETVTPYTTTPTLTAYTTTGGASQSASSYPRSGGFNRKFVAARFNYASDATTYPSNYGSMINTYAISSYFDGATTIYQNGHPKNPLLNGDTLQSGTYWASVAQGVYDTAFLTFFNQLAAAADSASTRLFRQHLPFLYSFAHEQSNQNDTTPNGPGAGLPSQYWPAHSHIYDLLVRNNLHVSVGGPIALCFCPDWKQVTGDPNWGPRDGQGNLLFPLVNTGYTVTNLLAGANLSRIDYAGGDIYSHTTSQTADLQWKPVHDWVASLGKPMIVPECGCDAGNGDDFCVSYWQTVDGYAHQWGGGTGAGNLHMICVTSKVASGGDFRMNATQAIYNQFLAMSREELWGASSSAAYTLLQDTSSHGIRVLGKQ